MPEQEAYGRLFQAPGVESKGYAGSAAVSIASRAAMMNMPGLKYPT